MRRGLLYLVVCVTTALLGLVYGMQVAESPLGWALVTAVIGLLCGRLMLALDISRPRSLWVNLLLGTLLGMVLGGLAGLPAVAVGAMAGEAAALLLFVLPESEQLFER